MLSLNKHLNLLHSCLASQTIVCNGKNIICSCMGSCKPYGITLCKNFEKLSVINNTVLREADCMTDYSNSVYSKQLQIVTSMAA